MKVPWASVEAPDTDGLTAERDENGEAYYFLFWKVSPPATVAIVPAKSVDNELRKRGTLDGEENGEVTEEVIGGLFDRFFRRHN